MSIRIIYIISLKILTDLRTKTTDHASVVIAVRCQITSRDNRLRGIPKYVLWRQTDALAPSSGDVHRRHLERLLHRASTRTYPANPSPVALLGECSTWSSVRTFLSISGGVLHFAFIALINLRVGRDGVHDRRPHGGSRLRHPQSLQGGQGEDRCCGASAQHVQALREADRSNRWHGRRVQRRRQENSHHPGEHLELHGGARRPNRPHDQARRDQARRRGRVHLPERRVRGQGCDESGGRLGANGGGTSQAPRLAGAGHAAPHVQHAHEQQARAGGLQAVLGRTLRGHEGGFRQGRRRGSEPRVRDQKPRRGHSDGGSTHQGLLLGERNSDRARIRRGVQQGVHPGHHGEPRQASQGQDLASRDQGLQL